MKTKEEIEAEETFLAQEQAKLDKLQAELNERQKETGVTVDIVHEQENLNRAQKQIDARLAANSNENLH